MDGLDVLRLIHLLVKHLSTILLLLLVYVIALLSILAEQAQPVFHKLI